MGLRGLLPPSPLMGSKGVQGQGLSLVKGDMEGASGERPGERGREGDERLDVCEWEKETEGNGEKEEKEN